MNKEDVKLWFRTEGTYLSASAGKMLAVPGARVVSLLYTVLVVVVTWLIL